MIEEPLLGAVIGSPVSHSLSPVIHRAANERAGRPGRFEARECPVERIGAVIESLIREGAVGASVTMPLKEVIVERCDWLDDRASRLGAVNCLHFDEGRVRGYNTDGDGCCDALLARGVPLAGQRAMVLGAGGAARSICLALAERGSMVSVVNRDRSRAERLIQLCEGSGRSGPMISVGDLSDLPQMTILVNATPVGMGGWESPVPREHLHAGLAVLDAVYHPLRTRLLTEASAAGATVVDGLWMLIHQACLQQEIWFGATPDPSVMREESERALNERPN